MINGVHHVSLATADMGRCLHFYRDLLGLTLIGEGHTQPGNTWFETVVGLHGARVHSAALRAGNVQIEVFQYEHPLPAEGPVPRPFDVGIRHVCFDVTDIQGEYERLKSAGVEFISGPQTMGNHKVKAVYARDPDNNIVELQEVFPGSLVNRSHVRGLEQTVGA
jgi:catechol 2,3-dioxygenase-like lactoylglutathione lyase family enzyme